ncbi:hypothetical protein IEO21_01403 [Rhodonia placenta]|uniref:Uncharacterized protein n=1 Tax=Rhodonia placenta TaxID=104341 RepID=A0A8H7P9T8_9APHY|nr:hypothetical protein IEO21_01403 [Postia placenta]
MRIQIEVFHTTVDGREVRSNRSPEASLGDCGGGGRAAIRSDAIIGIIACLFRGRVSRGAVEAKPGCPQDRADWFAMAPNGGEDGSGRGAAAIAAVIRTWASGGTCRGTRVDEARSTDRGSAIRGLRQDRALSSAPGSGAAVTDATVLASFVSAVIPMCGRHEGCGLLHRVERADARSFSTKGCVQNRRSWSSRGAEAEV